MISDFGFGISQGPNERIYGYLVCLKNNGNFGEWISLTTQTVSIGRDRHNDLVLNNQTISCNHCIIEFDVQGIASIVDVRSTNGTRIRTSVTHHMQPKPKCLSDHRYFLRDGCYIDMASLRFRFFYQKPKIKKHRSIEMIEM